MSTNKQEKLHKLLEQEQEKYHCRLCNRRFSSGRALGGHMRAHGVYNEPLVHPDEGPSTRVAEGGSAHICENCRQEFSSLRSLSKHCCPGCVGACGDDGAYDNSNGPLPPPSFPRSRTPTLPLLVTEEEHIAICLVLLSTARDNPVLRNTDAAECSTSVPRITDAGECSTSERKEVDHVVLPPPPPQPEPHVSTQTPPSARQDFECKTCRKVFTSYQALGGHRASHSKVKGCAATRLEIRSPKTNKRRAIEDESNNTTDQNNQAGSSSRNMALAIVPFVEPSSSQLPLRKKKPKVHECRVCNRQFPSGQALGGHMRCHWSRSHGGAAAVEPLRVAAIERQVGNSSSGLNVTQPRTTMDRHLILPLDLNMPAPIDDSPTFPSSPYTPTPTYLQPERENARENVLHVNIKQSESREVRLTDLSLLIDVNEREDGSTWLQLGSDPYLNQETRDDQP